MDLHHSNPYHLYLVEKVDVREFFQLQILQIFQLLSLEFLWLTLLDFENPND